MSDTFDVDVQQIQQVAKDWTTETDAMEKLPGQLSTIEGHLSSLLEHSFLQDLFNPAAEVVQTGIWFALRDALNKASGELGTLVQQLQADSQLLTRCSIEYQIADDAAANNITNIQSALSSNAPGSTQIRSLLNQLSGSDQSTAEQAAQGLVGATSTTGGGTMQPGGGGGPAQPVDGGSTDGSLSEPGGGSTGTSGTAGGSGSGGGSSTGTGGGSGSGGAGSGGGSGSTVTSGTGTGGAGSSTGGGSGSGGGSTGSGGVTNTTGGAWKTTGNWDGWVGSGDHDGPSTGQGVQTKLPDYGKLSTDRQQIMQNMVARVDHKVGYSQSADTDGYRDDCSGSVSAAWGLGKPGETCSGLMSSSVSHPISKDQLEPGDALIAQDHVVLFGGWANKEHTQYYALEDNGSQGSVAHVIPYPYYSENGSTPGGTYEPYRKNGVS